MQNSPADCDQSGTQFESPSATGKRPHPKLHFHSIFSSFYPHFRSLQEDLKNFRSAPLVQVSGMGPRQWRKFNTEVGPLARMF